MATFDDVDRLARALPGVAVGAHRERRVWNVGRTSIAWERPFTKADIKRFGREPVPTGPIVGFRTADLDDKSAVLDDGHAGVFTIEHLRGYPAVLVALDDVATEVLADLVIDAWLACAPAAAVEQYLAEHPLE